MEELSQKGLLAFGSCLFYTAFVFYGDLRRTQGGLSKADGCVFLTGDFPHLYEHCILFSDITPVAEACHGISASADDAWTDCRVGGLDICQPQAVPAFLSTQNPFVYQRGQTDRGYPQKV